VRAAEAVPAARRMIKKRKAPEQLLADKVKAALLPESMNGRAEGWITRLLVKPLIARSPSKVS
jgi:hypothetical protein